MRELKSLVAVLVVGIILFGGSTLFAMEQEQRQEQNHEQNHEQNQEKSYVPPISSPIQGKPLRTAGEYYSEELDTMLFHAGTDYAQAEGAVIRVKHSGTVVYAGPDPLLGYKVEIDCEEEWSVVYGGLKNLRVKEGDYVEEDEAIGQISYYPDVFGDLEQTHLHFEVWKGDLIHIPKL